MPTLRQRRWVHAPAVVLVVTVAVGVVAMVASSPLARSTPVNAASASTPVAALFLLLAGAGLIVLAGLVGVLRPGRRRKRDDEPELEPQQFEVPWLTKALAIALPLALAGAIVVAALTGVRKPASRAPLAGGLAPSRAGHALSYGATGKTGFVLPEWLPWTVLALLVAAAVVGLAFLATRRQPAEEPLEKPGATEAVTAAIEALDAHSDPRSAVIAAYAAMERTLAAHGLSRALTEAPREYLRHVLRAGRAREQDVRTLTALFEEARFSTHPIPERIRDAASAALRSLRRQLQTEART